MLENSEKEQVITIQEERIRVTETVEQEALGASLESGDAIGDATKKQKTSTKDTSEKEVDAILARLEGKETNYHSYTQALQNVEVRAERIGQSMVDGATGAVNNADRNTSEGLLKD